ncbi:hypothetical protein JQ625_21430 [Bradyrhizobium diazoefficiens]|nr:hypothetical protein [Bradyrhizobium diazoefficiens]MBR0777403.1 hypothetical protein [Bradyrhizobium diazoefficiens]
MLQLVINRHVASVNVLRREARVRRSEGSIAQISDTPATRLRATDVTPAFQAGAIVIAVN